MDQFCLFPNWSAHSSYCRGCRCAGCIDGQAEYAHDRRLTYTPPVLAPEDPRHGSTNAYYYYRCRCDRCKATIREVAKVRRGS